MQGVEPIREVCGGGTLLGWYSLPFLGTHARKTYQKRLELPFFSRHSTDEWTEGSRDFSFFFALRFFPREGS